ncbi:unnamed protein product [Brassica rapa subsp. narinosa]
MQLRRKEFSNSLAPISKVHMYMGFTEEPLVDNGVGAFRKS